jgi:hypothetical protein
MDECPPTREELIRARDDLQRELKMLRNPVRGGHRSRPLEAKLQAMLVEIDDCLAAMDKEDARTRLP